MENVVIGCAGLAGLAGLAWPSAALAGGIVFVLTELAARDGPAARGRSSWHDGAWRSLVGAAFIGAGQCCLGWSVGASLRLLAQ
jgi:hypothetical protein